MGWEWGCWDDEITSVTSDDSWIIPENSLRFIRSSKEMMVGFSTCRIPRGNGRKSSGKLSEITGAL